MLFLRRKKKDERATLAGFLDRWEQILSFDPEEHRNPTERLVDFLESLPESVELGRKLLEQAGNQGTSSGVNYLLDTLRRLPAPPATSTKALSDPEASWETLVSEAGIIATVVNRFRLYELRSVSQDRRVEVDRLRERAKELSRWADRGERFRAEYAQALTDLESAVAGLNRTLEEHDRNHPEYREYLRRLGVLYDAYRTGFQALTKVDVPEGLAVIVEALHSAEPERELLALDLLVERGWKPGTLGEKLDFHCAQAKRPDLRAKAVAELAAVIGSSRETNELVDVVEPRLAGEGLSELENEGLADLRALLLERIAALGGERASARLAAVIESPTETPSLKRAAVRLLAKSPDARSIELLVEAMGSPETEVRLAATEAMAVISPALAGLAVSHLESSVLERLVFALRDGEPAVRDAAVVSLRKYPQAVGPLVKTMTEDRNPAAREAAARTLASGCSPDPTSTAGLVRALSDDDAAVRRAAADALASQGRIPTATDERLLYLRAKQDWKSLRQFGATAVGQLVPLLKDRDEAVRLAAVRLLGSLRAREVAADVGNLLSDPSQEVRRQTAAVIATIGDASLVGSLRAALAREGFDDVRQEIENAIRRLDRK